MVHSGWPVPSLLMKIKQIIQMEKVLFIQVKEAILRLKSRNKPPRESKHTRSGQYEKVACPPG